MGTIDTGNATHPERRRFGGAQTKLAAHFANRMPRAAKRHRFIDHDILFPLRETPVNPERTEIEDKEATTRLIKDLALEMGVFPAIFRVNRDASQLPLPHL